MNKVQCIYLPNGRWRIVNNGAEGPVARYETPAFWPDSNNPELIGVSDYYGSATVWHIDIEVPQRDQEWIDKTLANA